MTDPDYIDRVITKINNQISVLRADRDSLKTAYLIADNDGATVSEISEYVDVSELHDHIRRMQDTDLIYRDRDVEGRPVYSVQHTLLDSSTVVQTRFAEWMARMGHEIWLDLRKW